MNMSRLHYVLVAVLRNMKGKPYQFHLTKVHKVSTVLISSETIIVK